MHIWNKRDIAYKHRCWKHQFALINDCKAVRLDHENKNKTWRRWDSLSNIKRVLTMARTKSVARKEPTGLQKAVRLPKMDNITLPTSPEDEGNILYCQYYIKFGMTEELKNRLKYHKGWDRKMIAKTHCLQEASNSQFVNRRSNKCC